jgi:hypothetical protein
MERLFILLSFLPVGFFALAECSSSITPAIETSIYVKVNTPPVEWHPYSRRKTQNFRACEHPAK